MRGQTAVGQLSEDMDGRETVENIPTSDNKYTTDKEDTKVFEDNHKVLLPAKKDYIKVFFHRQQPTTKVFFRSMEDYHKGLLPSQSTLFPPWVQYFHLSLGSLFPPQVHTLPVYFLLLMEDNLQSHLISMEDNPSKRIKYMGLQYLELRFQVNDIV